MKETKKNGAAQSKAGKRDYSAFKNMYRKIPQDLRDVIVYYIGDRPLVIHEGVNEVTGEVVTAEFIRQWHMDRDREVYNNNKHLKPPADENKKKQIREWEEAHPGEKCPDSYNLSLDASFADDEGSEDKSSLLYECAITMGAEDEEPDYIVRLHELMVESIYGNTPDVLSQLIRTMLIPKDGCEFIVADFSAIEARVLAWEAEEQWVLDAFQNGEDLYCATASQMFHVPVVKHGINGDLRQKGKIATLACGYGGSSGALISMGALQMGLHEEELPEIIDSWREANPKIVQYWWDTEKAAMTAYKTGERQEVGKIAFEFYSGTLWMVLPSGRRLAYLKPKQQPNRFGRMSLTYEGVGQNHKWSRQETYSGRLVENATQAIARDILAEAMDRISAEGLNIVAHVHDEVIIEAPKGQYTVDEVCKLMSVNPAWCKGLPLAAAGYKGDYAAEPQADAGSSTDHPADDQPRTVNTVPLPQGHGRIKGRINMRRIDREENRYENRKKFAGSPGRTEPSESGKAGLYQSGTGDAPPGRWTHL